MKVTTLIPAYKPKYLVELLTALRHQTVKPARIIVSDDSPDQAFIALLEAEPLRRTIADLNVCAIPGPRSGAYNNFRNLLKVWNGETELFHLLLDDDVIYPSFYQRHLAAHATGGTKCSISRRWTAIESGQPIRDLPVPPGVDAHPSRVLALEPSVLFRTTVGVSSNWLGEFSNAVFSADLTEMVFEPSLHGICYTGLEDLGAFLNASLRAPIGYINEHLGYFRTSAEQHSANPMGRPMKLAHLAYLGLAIAARRIGQLSEAECQRCVATLAPLVAARYGAEEDMASVGALMPDLAIGAPEAEHRFLLAWNDYLGR